MNKKRALTNKEYVPINRLRVVHWKNKLWFARTVRNKTIFTQNYHDKVSFTAGINKVKFQTNELNFLLSTMQGQEIYLNQPITRVHKFFPHVAGRSGENLLTLILPETFFSLRFWITHVKKDQKLWVAEFVAEIRCRKDYDVP